MAASPPLLVAASYPAASGPQLCADWCASIIGAAVAQVNAQASAITAANIQISLQASTISLQASTLDAANVQVNTQGSSLLSVHAWALTRQWVEAGGMLATYPLPVPSAILT